jgi:hypothetical protein
VPLAPRHWPGKARVLTLAATLKLVFGKEYEIVLRPAKGSRSKVKYTDLTDGHIVQFYPEFKAFYDHNMQRTLT